MGTHDLKFTKDGTDFKYMCRQQGQTKDFRIIDSPLLPQTLITGSASPSNIQPEKRIQISQVDWRKGIQDFLLKDEHKYYDSNNCDARMKGQVILSPKKLTDISFPDMPPTATLTDGGLEIWVDANNLFNWTKTGNGVLRNSTVKHGGSFSAKNATDPGTGTIYQDISWNNLYRLHTFTFTCWASRTSSSCWVKISIDDGVEATQSDAINTLSDTWQQGTITRKLDANATRLRLIITYSVIGGQHIYWDDAALTYTADSHGAVVDTVEFGDNIIVAMGNCLWNIASGSAVYLHAFPKTITDLCVFKNRLYIAQGWADEYFYTSALVTFTECTLSNSTAKYMSNVGNAQFWIADTVNTMRVSGNPINGGTSFSTPYTVRSSAWQITGLVDHDEIVFVRKQDQPYYLSGADVFPLLPISAEASTTYTYGLYRWGECLYIPSGVGSLYEYDIESGRATVISPASYAPGSYKYDEEITAICHDGTYLYVAVDDTSRITILAGRWENVDGDTDWYWHPLYDKESNDIKAMLISSLSGNKRLYAGTDTYTDGIYSFIVPINYSTIFSETAYYFEASGTLITPWLTSNFPTEKKFWKSIDITSICITGKTSITPYYRVKGGSWVAMANCTTNALKDIVIPIGECYPDETTDSREIGVSSERIQFSFVMATTSDGYTPILYGSGGGLVTFAILQADRKRQIEATILLAPKIRLRDNTLEDRAISTDLSNLRALYEYKGAMTLTGPDETSYNIVFAREGYEEQLSYKLVPNAIINEENWWVSVKLLEV